MRVRLLVDDVKLREPPRGTMHNIRTLHVYEGPSEVEIGMDRGILIELGKQIQKELDETTE
jgi:hypothetical protein